MPKSKDKGATPRRKRVKKQLVLSPINQTVNSEDSTLPWHPPTPVLDDNETVSQENMNATLEQTLAGNPASDSEGSDLSDPEDLPLRPDLPVKDGRWSDDEVDALMDAANVNRDALKFHYRGTGGGKDVKRQGWKDVAKYVNDVAATHRTVKQCVKKVSDFTIRQKGRFNRLRREVGKTGRGKIGKKFLLSDIQQKALDYIKEEAITGIPGVSVMPTSQAPKKPVSEENTKLLWTAKRENKPDYSKINMPRAGVPKNYKQKEDNRKVRLEKLQRKKDHEEKMKKERKREEQERERNEKENRIAELNRDKRMKAMQELKENAKNQQDAVFPHRPEYVVVQYKKKDSDVDEEQRLAEKAERKAQRAGIRAAREERRRLRKEIEESN